MAMWNPWKGCKKCSDGCRYCYFYLLHLLCSEQALIKSKQRLVNFKNIVIAFAGFKSVNCLRSRIFILIAILPLCGSTNSNQ